MKTEQWKKTGTRLGSAIRFKTVYCGKTYGWKEYLLGFAVGALAGYGVGLIMFQRLFLELFLALAAGLWMGKWYIRWCVTKRRREFLNQFCDYLDSISSSLSVGKNSYESFLSANEDMQDLYRAESAICKESARLASGLKSGRAIPDLLEEMAEDSQCGDVRTFGEIYAVCSRAGGNLKKIVDDTRNMLVEKTAVEEEIQTILSGPKNELNVMAIMPLIILAALRILGGDLLTDNAASLTVNLIALGVFVGSYLMGRRMVEIKV